MGLPFIKAHKRPRVAKPGEDKLPEEKIINGSDEDYLEAHCANELMDSYKAKDPKLFRQALESVVMNLFKDSNAATAG